MCVYCRIRKPTQVGIPMLMKLKLCEHLALFPTPVCKKGHFMLKATTPGITRLAYNTHRYARIDDEHKGMLLAFV